MDAFLKRQLFAQDVVVLLGQPEEQEGNENAYEKLRALVKTHGGIVVDQKDKQDPRVNVVVVVGQDQDQDEMLRCFPSAVVLRAQWVQDSVLKNRRLATTSYRVLKSQDSSSGTELPTKKKQKVASADLTASSGVTEAASEGLNEEPHLRPWKTVLGSVHVLDARSQKQNEKIRGSQSYKIAGFDLDWTLIVTKSGKKFAHDRNDWKLFHPTLVKDRLSQLVRDGFTLAIFSNQNGVAKGHITLDQIENKLEAIVKELNLPMLVFLSLENDIMRKPRLGAWKELAKLLNATSEETIDKKASFYCGDAAGRPKTAGRSKDFAATDYKFALNAGIRFFTPEDFFLGTKQRIHTRPDMWELGFDPKSIALNETAGSVLSPSSADIMKEEQELVVLVGPPASGKSFFAKTHMSSYVLVSQDELRTAANCKKKCLEAIAQKKSVVIDNTNRDPRARKEWIVIAKEKELPIRCFQMDVDKPLAMHLNTFRSLTQQKKIPDVAIHGFYKNFVPPTSFVTQEAESEIRTKQTQSMSSKIKDGLFMGDIDAAQDADFLQLNGIVHIINCVPRQVPNIFQQSLGLSYVACDLDEVLRQPFFDLKNREFTYIVQLIDQSLERTESVLVHSLNGINRSPSIMIGYLMVKYCWGLDKAHEFVQTKRADIKLHESYVDQLCSLEAQIQEERSARATELQLYEWSTRSADPKTDELVLIHTFLNTASAIDTHCAPERRRINTSRSGRSAGSERRLTWIDQALEMRKLHPSLIVRPERPPNKSYNKMNADDGWVDLLDPSPVLVRQAKLKKIGPLTTRVAFAESSTPELNPMLDALTISRYLDQSEPEVDVPGSAAADASLVHNDKRFHSFSAPKKTEVLDEEASTSPSTVSDELDFVLEGTSDTSRYARDNLTAINSRRPRQSSAHLTSIRSSTTSTKNVPHGRSSSSGAILGSRGPKEGKEPIASSKRMTKKTEKGATATNSRIALQGGRVCFSVDLPPPQASAAPILSRSRGHHIRTDSLSQQSQMSAPIRPRTAPLRRKDVETKDLLQSTKIDLGGSSRITTDSKASHRLSSSLDSMNSSDLDTTRGPRRISSSTTYGNSRVKTTRASWR